MRPYHPNNLGLQPYAHWRVIALAWAGKLLGVQFKISGIPFGGKYRTEKDERDSGGTIFRVDREGNCVKPERKVVLRAAR
jgi:hypothetical protein